MVLIVFATTMLKKLKEIHKKLKEIISDIVTQELKSSLVETLEKQNANLTKVLEQPVKKIMKDVFNRSLNMVMDMHNLPRVDKDSTDEIIEGNGGSVAKMFNKSFGIDYHICLGIVGLLNEDPAVIIESVIELSGKLDISHENTKFDEKAYKKI